MAGHEFAEIIRIIVWPAVVITGLLLLRAPITNLLNAVGNLEYSQDEEGKKRILVSFLKPVLDNAKEALKLPQKSKEDLPYPSDPKLAILNALIDLEKAAEQKLKDLNIDYRQNGFKNTALVYLELRGCFPPKIETAIQNLIMLRNQVAHYSPTEISAEDANEYVRVKDAIKKVIEGIQSLPAVQLHAITMIMRNIAVVIDTGKYNHITISEVYGHIKDETVLTFISQFEEAHELRGILKSDLWKGFDRFYTKSLLSIYNGYGGDHRRKWGIENSGLCLALAWTIEIIQMGSGWHPNENLSEL